MQLFKDNYKSILNLNPDDYTKKIEDDDTAWEID